MKTGPIEAAAPAPRRADRLYDALALALAAAGLVVALALAAASRGFYHDDDVQHYLFARRAWHSREALLHWWGRPGYTIPTMFVAHAFGMLGCRVFSALQTAVVAVLAYRIARRLLGPSPASAAAAALVWLQPLVMTLGTTTLTETPAALYLTLAVWLYLRGHRIGGCAVMSLTFVTRYETMALGAIFALAVAVDAWRTAGSARAAVRTRWAWAALAALAWAPLAYLAVSLLLHVPTGASPLQLLWQRYTAEYGHGKIHHFLVRWYSTSGAGVLACAAVGAIAAARRAWLPLALTAGLVTLHSVLFALGAFASGGYARFLVPVGGLVAVLAAAGLRVLWRGRRRLLIAVYFAAAAAWIALVHRERPWLVDDVHRLAIWPLAGAAGLALLAANRRLRGAAGKLAVASAVVLIGWHARKTIRPLPTDRDPLWPAIIRCVEASQQGPGAGRPAIASHPLVVFLRPNTTQTTGLADALVAWRCAPAGTLFVWENKYSSTPHQAERSRRLRDQLERLGRSIRTCASGEHRVEVFLRLPNAPPAGPGPGDAQSRPTCSSSSASVSSTATVYRAAWCSAPGLMTRTGPIRSSRGLWLWP